MVKNREILTKKREIANGTLLLALREPYFLTPYVCPPPTKQRRLEKLPTRGAQRGGEGLVHLAREGGAPGGRDHGRHGAGERDGAAAADGPGELEARRLPPRVPRQEAPGGVHTCTLCDCSACTPVF